MPNTTNQGQDNKTTGGKSSGTGSGGGAASGAGMQVSGEEIFLPEDTQPKVTKESDVFGQQPQPSDLKAAQPQTAQAKQPASTDNKQQPAAQASDTAKQAAQQVNQVLSGDFQPVTDAYNQVKETAGAVAGQVYDKAQDKAGAVITEQKKSLAQGLGSVADNIRKFGDNLNAEQSNPIGSTAAKYGDTVAEQIENLSAYIERGDFRTFAADLQDFARRNPTLFVAGAFGLGLIAARFLKSSPRSASSRGNLENGRAGQNSRSRNSGRALNTGHDKAASDKGVKPSASSPTI